MFTPGRSWLVRMLGAVAFSVAGAVLASCDDDSNSTLPTHTNNELSDALTSGVLVGTRDCLWIESATGEPLVLVFPAGTTTERRSERIAVLHASGELEAHAGDEVEAGGESGEAGPTCASDDDQARRWLVKSIRSCTAGQCEPLD
jgi:hypothetical protein